ncbi:hypothetical protein ACIQZO_12825 [Streptomyces sp. NPDC097617]|uniref:hypothetical protein n=1 Tax=Streptomyces sp. NPDC097617 TaxID=3366091 RepID=UPI00380BEDBE
MTRIRTRRLVLITASAALVVGGALLAHGAFTAPAVLRAPHAPTTTVSHDHGSGHRLLSVLKHLWTTAAAAGDAPEAAARPS